MFISRAIKVHFLLRIAISRRRLSSSLDQGSFLCSSSSDVSRGVKIGTKLLPSFESLHATNVTVGVICLGLYFDDIYLIEWIFEVS